MRTVLILDADPISRRRISSAMRYAGFETKIARNLRNAQQLLRSNRYAALIVDPGLNADARQLVAELRAQTNAPIIAVSEPADPLHKIALLDGGADDYMTLPFDPEELLARLRAVSRRVPQFEDALPIVTPDFTIHLADRRLVRNDHTEIELSPTEWRLIEALARRAGHLVTREELLAAVWGPQAADKTNYLRVHMASIRHKIEPEPSQPRYFITLPGLGLRFDPADSATQTTDEHRTLVGAPHSAAEVTSSPRDSGASAARRGTRRPRLGRVDSLVESHADASHSGYLGEKMVNARGPNLALDNLGR